MNAAQDEVGRTETKRQKVLIKARKAEAEMAERRAKQAMEEVKQERKKSEELSERLKKLESEPTKRGMVLTLGDLLFDYDKAELNSGGFKVIERLSLFLGEYQNRTVRIEGYTDSTGPRRYNEKLSLRRVTTVQEALISRGINPDRITVRGYGEQFPVASNTTEAGRQQNRRVEIVISDKSGDIAERNQ